jgi:hypothetical protein
MVRWGHISGLAIASKVRLDWRPVKLNALAEMMKRLRFVFGFFVLFFGLMAINARAQSSYQRIAFFVMGQFESATNDIPSEPNVTDHYLHLLEFTSVNVVKAIAVDQFGTPDWTNWAAAGLVRRINLVTGEEVIYLSRGGTNVVDVSSYFKGSYLNNFMSGVPAAFPAGTNNFTPNNPNPYEQLFSGVGTNRAASAGLFFFSVTTTNLKMNLIGANFSFLGNGVVTNFHGIDKGTNYAGDVEAANISVVGTFSWTRSTNLFNLSPGTNTFYSGPARGTVTLRDPVYSTLDLPPEMPQ